MFDEQEHQGAVKSRIHATCLVAEPVVVMLEGKEVDLAVQDAELLMGGLAEAIARVKASRARLMGDGRNYNVMVLAKSGTGMSLPSSKLGDGQSLLKSF